MPTPYNLQENFRVSDVAKRWGVSEEFVRRTFRNEKGVLRFGRAHREKGRAPHLTLVIPLAVLERVERRAEVG